MLQENLNQEGEVSSEIETIHEPVVINDIKCKHYYSLTFIGDDGYHNAKCKDCIMGIRWNPEFEELVEGKLRKKNG